MSAIYLLSSLPNLEFGMPPPLSLADFRSRCEGVAGVSLGDFDAVAAGLPGKHPFTESYSNALTEIKNITASLRASEWGAEHAKFSERPYSNFHADLQRKIAEACAMKNPLEREMALEKAHWQITEELSGLAYFSEAKLYAYIVKLQINSRLANLTEESGRAAVEEFIKANDREVAKN